MRRVGHRLRVPEVPGPERPHHLLQASGMVGVPMCEDDPLEVGIAVLPVDPRQLQVPLREVLGGGLPAVVVAVDQSKAPITGVVCGLDDDHPDFVGISFKDANLIVLTTRVVGALHIVVLDVGFLGWATIHFWVPEPGKHVCVVTRGLKCDGCLDVFGRLKKED